MNRSGVSKLLIFMAIAMMTLRGNGQTALPEVLEGGTLIEQMDYIEQRTRIYENYRAIREDLFQKIKQNSIDSLRSSKAQIASLLNSNTSLSDRIDSLNRSLAATSDELREVTQTKNSVKIIGIQLTKITYNLIMLSIIGGLLFILIAGYLVYKRTRAVTVYTKREFKELSEQFEAYRKESREAREKLVMSHFNEVKRLKGG